MEQTETLEAIRESLEDLARDEDVTRHVRERLDEMLRTLEEPIDLELRVDKLRDILEALDGDSSIPGYARTQLWNVSAMLELL